MNLHRHGIDTTESLCSGAIYEVAVGLLRLMYLIIMLLLL